MRDNHKCNQTQQNSLRLSQAHTLTQKHHQQPGFRSPSVYMPVSVKTNSGKEESNKVPE